MSVHVHACQLFSVRMRMNAERLVQCVSDRTLFPSGGEQNRLSSRWAELENTADKRRRPPTTRPLPACVYSTPRAINRCVTRITARLLRHVPSPSERSLVHVLYGFLTPCSLCRLQQDMFTCSVKITYSHCSSLINGLSWVTVIIYTLCGQFSL